MYVQFHVYTHLANSLIKAIYINTGKPQKVFFPERHHMSVEFKPPWTPWPLLTLPGFCFHFGNQALSQARVRLPGFQPLSQVAVTPLQVILPPIDIGKCLATPATVTAEVGASQETPGMPLNSLQVSPPEESSRPSQVVPRLRTPDPALYSFNFYRK